jgi:prevent-host-death family protein
MKTVNIGTLKNNLSAYLQHVRQGEEVIVQDRKKPIARIVPILPDEATDEEARLIAAGIMTPAKEEMDWEAFNRLPLPEAPEGAAKEALDWVRGKA